MTEADRPAEQGGRPQNLAGRARAALMSLLDAHHHGGGVGPDAYHAAPLAHPMAEGRFLAAAAIAAQTRLISQSQLRAMAEAALSRLNQAALPFAGGIGWGLGFDYAATDAREPFLITTAMIAEGLIELTALLPDLPQAAELLDGSLGAIQTWCRTESVLNADLGIALPIYSPTVRRPILNAAIYAISVHLRGQPDGLMADEFRSQLCEIRALRQPGIGWSDDPASPVIDLLHQCFILNSLSAGLPADQRDRAAEDLALVETMSLFSAAPGFLDTASLVAKPELPPAGGTALLRVGDAYLAIKPNPARLWSLGELLVTLSGRIADRVDGRSDRWRGYAAPVCEAVLMRLAAGDGEALYPRQRMYAAFGLARFMAAIRQGTGVGA
ncbi:hypothetical protein CX676_22390 (plasmid) [Paracoccus zhejiangensis]|uniref:Lanthionine synthetase n=1 Tax=Paracoccus zhejiangensis TaxID=1077935 RepID=A0A2H5F665_9RHOB|nr:hypothetical protein CX676_22390 [Paracoccus zhejiangensis]